MIPARADSISLLEKHIAADNLRHHCYMVARAMEAYARHQNKPDEEVLAWWTAGLLHDLDWESHPDIHPAEAVERILPEHGYPEEIRHAIEAHAPERTGREPAEEMERYLFACDELSGFMHAVSLMRPNGFSDMRVKSVRKKLKDKRFAENVPRDDIRKGAVLIGADLTDHIAFLIDVFRNE